MRFKPTLVLDGATMFSGSDFHDQISKMPGFPSFYGRNLDSLWECLTGFVDRNVKIVWLQHELSEKRLGETYKSIVSMFEDIRKSHPEFEFELR